jgi:hypothetical protein
MMPVMTNEEIDRKLGNLDKSLDDQQTELVSHSDQIRALKEKHGKEIEALQGDIKNLAELVWCVIHRIKTQSLIHGIDDLHHEMALTLANKHGVGFPGSKG